MPIFRLTIEATETFEVDVVAEDAEAACSSLHKIEIPWDKPVSGVDVALVSVERID